MKHNTFTTLDGSALKIGVVAARFGQELTGALLEDCLAALEFSGVPKGNIFEVRVSGSFELPYAASALIAAHLDVDAVICLGIIIKGETRHDEYIAQAVSQGLMRVSLDQKKPVLFGVLTTENRDQAGVRVLGGHKKGWEAGLSAVEMALVKF